MPARRASSRSDSAARPSVRTRSQAAARIVARAASRRAVRQSTLGDSFNTVTNTCTAYKKRQWMYNCEPCVGSAVVDEALLQTTAFDALSAPAAEALLRAACASSAWIQAMVIGRSYGSFASL